MSAGIRKSERVKKERGGEGTYVTIGQGGPIYQLTLHWIPSTSKNAKGSKYVPALGRIIHYRRKIVQDDINAIRAIWRLVSPKPPECGLRMRMEITIYRPMSASEMTTGRWNRRRGDTVGAHHLICDALQSDPKEKFVGWYEDDSQVTKIEIEELRDVAAPSVLVKAYLR